MLLSKERITKSVISLWTFAVIHLQFWAYGSWDSLFPISMSPTANLWVPKIAPDKDWRQLGIHPPLFGLSGYFKFWIGYFNFLYWVSIWKQISNETGPSFSWLFCLLSVSLSESTLAILVYIWDRYFQLISKIQRIYQFIFDSSNHQRGIRVSYDMILFNCSKAFSPTLRHCYCKARRMS